MERLPLEYLDRLVKIDPRPRPPRKPDSITISSSETTRVKAYLFSNPSSLRT